MDSPLHVAVRSNKFKTVYYLLTQKAAINARGTDDLSPLHLAVRQQYLDICKLLHSYGADVNAEARDKITPLHTAAQAGGRDVAKYLLDCGASIDAQDAFGNTPLHLSVRSKSAGVAGLLLESGCSVDSRDQDGNAALHLAIEPESVTLLKLLLEYKPNVNAKCNFGYTPLHVAAWKSRNPEIFKLLVEAGADVNSEASNKRYAPLHIAVQSSKARDILRLVRESNASSRSKSKTGKTPLHETAKASGVVNTLKKLFDSEVNETAGIIVKLLLDAGAVVDAQDEDGHTALHMVSDFGRTATLKMLVRHGASVDARSRDCNTPLHYAIYRDNLNNVKFLVDCGADVNAWNGLGESPLLMATFSRDMNIVKVLINAGANANELTQDGLDVPMTSFINSLQLESRIKKKGLTEETLRFIIEYTDVNLTSNDSNILRDNLSSFRLLSKKKFLYKIVLEHIAKLKVLGLAVDSSILKEISNLKDLDTYLTDCEKELKKAKSIHLAGSEVTFFDLLVISKYKLVKYFENLEIMKDFKNNVKLFPLYKPWLMSNMTQAVENRKLLEGAASGLAQLLPIFKPSGKNSIIVDVLDVLSDRDWRNLSNQKCSYDE